MTETLATATSTLQVLQQAVALSPDHGFEKYMYLGQLLDGGEAIQAASRGVDVLSAAAQSAAESQSSDADELNAQLCGALCSLAEMKMTQSEDVAQAGVLTIRFAAVAT